MHGNGALRLVLSFVLLVGLTAALSQVSVTLWGDRPATGATPVELVVNGDMTVREFGAANGLANPVLKKALGLQTREDLARPLASFGLDDRELGNRIARAAALAAEHESKNWVKIPLKRRLFLGWKKQF